MSATRSLNPIAGSTMDPSPLLAIAARDDLGRLRAGGRRPSLRGAARFLRRASSRRLMREPSMVVRETAAEQLEERQSDWAYSKPVVFLDIMWNLAFVAVAAGVLGASTDERPTMPLRLWIAGYAVQCGAHMVCVCIEYQRRRRPGLSERLRGGDGSSGPSSPMDVEEGGGGYDSEPNPEGEGTSVAKHLESANTTFSFIWWIIGFYWVSAGGPALTRDSRFSIRSRSMFLQRAWRTAAFGVYGFTQFTKSGFLEHSKGFKAEDMQHQMEGKNCIVTGANSGIGYATAEGLASRGATVYMVCRSKERGEAALAKLKSTTSNQNIHLEVCDLSSLNEVKAFTSKFSSEQKPLHVLINNAGVLENNRVTTPEGFEVNFAVNVAATYTLTELMMPLLGKAAPDARVITVSSGGMYTAPLTKDLQFSESEFDGSLQYARNKRIQVALTEKWAEIYGDKGVGFYSMHPGWAETPGVAKSLPGFSERMAGKLRSSEEGADTVIWLALQPKEKLVSGAFYFDRAEAPKHLRLAGTAGSHSIVGEIIDNLRSLCGLPS